MVTQQVQQLENIEENKKQVLNEREINLFSPQGPYSLDKNYQNHTWINFIKARLKKKSQSKPSSTSQSPQMPLSLRKNAPKIYKKKKHTPLVT